jgi:beta-glucanase (GH16 family)/glycerophosphoryl diester phosphodiesterase
MKKIFFPIAIIILASCSVTKENTSSPKFADNTVVAHRGAWKKNNLPQNSIASLKEAIALGCTGSEFDVRMTSDDSLIINHDPHYNNLEIEKTTYSELIRHPLSNGETLPTLRQYLLAGLNNNAHTRLVVEIKPSGVSKERAKQVTATVIDLIHQLHAQAWVMYISFDYDILKEVLRLEPSATVQYLNGDKSPQQLKADKMDGADYHYSVYQQQPSFINELKKLNLKINAWTVDDPLAMDWLLSENADYITTNEPEILLQKSKSALINNGWQLAWSDEFNYKGLPDTEKWNYDTGGHGWGNNELQYYTQADTNNAVVRNGLLNITARKQTKEKSAYTSARLITKNKGDWKYGRIEVRAKLPAGRGLWPAIWMLPTDWEYGGWPNSGEIDIMEHVGYKKDSVFFSIHTEAFNHIIGTQKTKGIGLANLYDSFHVYAIEWTEHKIDFLMDNKTVFSYSNPGKTYKEWPFDKRFHLLLNMAVGGNWGGQQGIDETIFPATMLIDYVRVFQKK